MTIDPTMIPPEVVEVGAIEIAERRGLLRECAWADLPDFVRDDCRNTARAAIAAALAAWPGVQPMIGERGGAIVETAIILPLPPQEASDGE